MFSGDGFFLHTRMTSSGITVIIYCDSGQFYHSWVWTTNILDPCDGDALAVIEGEEDHVNLRDRAPMVRTSAGWVQDEDTVTMCGGDDVNIIIDENILYWIGFFES